MSSLQPQPLQFVLVAFAGWLNQQQRDVIEYLQAENRALREQLGPRRLRFYRRAAPATGGTREDPRPPCPRRPRHDCDAGHAARVAPNSDRQAIRWESPWGSGATARHGRDSRIDRPDGGGQSRLGLHADPGSPGNLHHDVSRGTIATVLREHGLDAAPERLKKATWAEFLRAHWDLLAAADFFTVHVWTGRGLTRFAVLFVIELSPRGASRSPGSRRSPTPRG